MKKYTIILLVTILSINLISCKQDERQKPAKVNSDLFDFKGVGSFYIYFDQPDYFEVLTNYKKHKDTTEKNIYIPAHAVINDCLIKNIGIRFKGESSYKYYPGLKKSFKVNLKKFNNENNCSDYKKLNLLNCFKDPTLMREKLFFDILNYLGVPSIRTSFTKVYVNEEYYGPYLIAENIDKEFLTRTFNNSNGSFFKGEPQAYLTWKGSDSTNYYRSYISNSKNSKWNDLLELIKALQDIDEKGNELNSSSKEYEENIKSILNVEGMLKTWALCNVLVNIDAFNMYYPHNFYLYKDETSGQFNWLIYDANYAFGAWTPDLSYQNIVNYDILNVDTKFEQKNTINKVLANKELKKEYLKYVKLISDSVLKTNFIQDRIIDYNRQLVDLIEKDSMKMYSFNYYQLNQTSSIGDTADPGAFIPGLKKFISDRSLAIDKQLNEYLANE